MCKIVQKTKKLMKNCSYIKNCVKNVAKSSQNFILKNSPQNIPWKNSPK